MNWYKYLPTSSKDESWGLYVLNTGCSRITETEIYPSPDHPAHHYFNWNKGRVLNEHHMVYIAKGSGIFESASCKQRIIHEGTILMLFPDEWHRYKPDIKTGWDEYWVGFKGNVVDNIVRQQFFTRENAVLKIGLHEIIIQLFTKIIEETKDEKPGYQPLVSGVVMHLLGVIYSLAKTGGFSAEGITESIINKARIILRTNIDHAITMEKVAEELNVSYAWFRKAFKAYTGIAPQQYLIQLRIEKAKAYLADRSLSVKEIALRLNFESIFYFSRLFKEKTGVSPDVYRKGLRLDYYTKGI